MGEGSEATVRSETMLRDMVGGFLRGYTGPPEIAADELIRMIRLYGSRAALARIADEVRPKLDQDSLRGGYDCCGCSSYERIVDDIEAIVRDVLAYPEAQMCSCGYEHSRRI